MYFQHILLLVLIFCNINNVIGQTLSIGQYIQSDIKLSTLKEIINSPGSVELLTLLSTVGGPKMTLFAPTDGAFMGIDRTNETFTLNLLKYHTVPDKAILSKDLPSNLAAKTLLNDPSLVNLPIGGGQVLYLTKSSDGGITINGNTQSTPPIRITQVDIECSNGVIHLIDAVAIPPRSLIDTANSLGLTQFINEFTDANLLSNSNSSSGITIFVPTNEAFDRSNISTLDSLERKALLQRHVIVANVIYEIKDGMNMNKLYFKVTDGITYVNDGKVEKSDILLQNGVMYLINNVLSFEKGNNGSDKPKKVEGYEGNNDTKSDPKLIIGAVLGSICGLIVITLFSCMLFRWYRAHKRTNIKYRY